MNRTKRDFVISTGIELTQKFGFLPRSIVWKHLAPAGQTSKYYYWQLLSNVPQFAVHDLGVRLPDYLMLSSECRKLLGGASCVRTRSMTYFKHDEALMDFVLHLRKHQLISQYWTEQELRKDRNLARQILGGDPDDKVPDLVFDLNAPGKPARVAVENERTRKSQQRYKRVHFGYRRLKSINLILFGTSDRSTESAIQREFERKIFTSEALPYGCFSLKDFCQLGLECELRVQGEKRVLGKLLSYICGRDFENDPEKDRNPFQVFDASSAKVE